jgi:CRISPR/Cas system CMR-associated protein Cmr5 small subunit
VNQFTNNHAGKDGNDFITEDDKTAKANAGIVGYSIATFLIAVAGVVATILTCGAAGVPMLSLTGFFIGLGIGVVASGVEFGVTELIKYVNKEFDDYCKEHPGIIIVIGLAMTIAGILVGSVIGNAIAKFAFGAIAAIETAASEANPESIPESIIPESNEALETRITEAVNKEIKKLVDEKVISLSSDKKSIMVPTSYGETIRYNHLISDIIKSFVTELINYKRRFEDILNMIIIRLRAGRSPLPPAGKWDEYA